MGKVIAIVSSQKGAGSTTTAINLSACLAALEQKVLLIDTDPRADATAGIGFDPRNIKTSIYECITHGVDPLGVISETEIPNLDLLPAHIDLIGTEIEIIKLPDREKLMSKCIDKIKNNYDFIIIDCSSSLGLITINSLTAADSVILPISCESDSLDGLARLLNTIKIVQNRLNSDLDIEGVLLTMFNRSSRFSNQTVEEVKKHFQMIVLNTIIEYSVDLAESPNNGQSIVIHKPDNKGAVDYLNLAREILSKIRLYKVTGVVSINIYDKEIPQYTIENIYLSVEDFMDSLGFILEAEKQPVYGSFFQTIIFFFKKPSTQKEIEKIYQKGKDALEAKFINQPNAEVTEKLAISAAQLIKSIEPFNECIIRTGAILIIKKTNEGKSVLVVETVSPEITQKLDENPSLSRDFSKILEILQNNNSNNKEIK